MTTNFSLSLASNYLDEIDADEQMIYNSYLSLNQTLLNHIQSNIELNNENYLKFIILYGYETIGHIFKLLLQYTRCLELTIHHTEKSILFYVEFITQIGDENHSFLQLNSKDAIIFLYKKTIFEIDESYLATFMETSEDNYKISKLHQLTTFVLSVLQHSLKYYTNMDDLMTTCLATDKQIQLHYLNLYPQIENYTLLVNILMEEYTKTTELLKFIIKLRKKLYINPLEIISSIKQSKQE